VTCTRGHIDRSPTTKPLCFRDFPKISCGAAARRRSLDRSETPYRLALPGPSPDRSTGTCESRDLFDHFPSTVRCVRKELPEQLGKPIHRSERSSSVVGSLRQLLEEQQIN